MKKLTSMLMCVVATGWAGGALAQDLYAPDRTTDSRVERVRGDADDARRRETDLAAQIATQERTNATLRDQLRKVDADPAGLQRDLVDASAEAASLRKRVAEQRLRRDVAGERLDEARGRVLGRLEQTDQMQAARRAAADAAAEAERLSQPILERLADNPDYQEAQALVDAAAQTGEALQGFDGVDPKAMAEADAAFDQAMAAARAIEEAAVDADPTAREARKSLKVAVETLDAMRTENEKKLAGDPGVDSAKFAFELEQKLLDDNTAQLATAEKRLSALRQTTAPNAGPPTELAGQLKDGEARLRDLNDQLEQARIARQDAEDRLRYAENSVPPARGSDEGGYVAPPPAYDPPVYERGYDDYGYPGGGYYPAPSYGYPSYGYGYPYSYGYSRSYYDPFYCPPYYGSGLFLGLSFSSYSSRPWWHRHSYYRPYYYDHGHYGHDRVFTYGYASNHFRDDGWRNRYDYWRSRDGGSSFRDGRSRGDGRSGVASSDRRYDYYRFNSNDLARDRSARNSLDRARQATAGVERDYRYRTYNYPGSTASLRARQFEQDVRDRQAVTASDSVRRSTGNSRLDDQRDRAATELRNERSAADDARRREAADSSARRARAAEDSSRARSGESSVRSGSINTPSGDERRGRGGGSDDAAARSRAAEDARSARAADEIRRARSSDDSPSRSRDTGSAQRGRSEAAPTPAPSRSRSEATPTPSPSRSRGDSTPAPSRSRGDPTPAPSPSRARSTPPPPPPSPSGGSARGGGSSRGGDSAPSGGSSRGGASRGGDAPSGGGSSRGSSGGGGGGGSSRAGSSSNDAGGRRR